MTRYLIAALPPESIAEPIWAYKRYVAEHYGSVRGLRVLPHITYVSPFTLSEKVPISSLAQQLESFLGSFQAETIQLTDFGYFSTNRGHVIYVAVEKTERMEQQYLTLDAFVRESLQVSLPPIHSVFTPHLTIAYRDLSRRQFEQAWPYFEQESFSARMPLDALWLLQHTGKQWEPLRKFDFASNA
ncbi:2'-5' RNA ligase family protein [Siphonobacter sp. BAB-5385]|uniref:2'-5' RNA ligase family protein n=1 Tax=Siphonobacter sp. BAB-5385 TaxID=1864822 RepID=UPI0015951467|nr:2'-5' RNA ligase family protein [Siphonobacter sp. BAB-5385]